MASYRATHNEPRVGVGEWTGDLTKGSVYSDLPKDVADHLVEQGLLIEVKGTAKDNPWFDSDDPDLAAPADEAKEK